MSKDLFGEEMSRQTPRPPQHYQSGHEKNLKQMWVENRNVALDTLAAMFMFKYFIPKNNEKQLPF